MGNVYEATSSSGSMRGYQIKGNEEAGGRMSALARDSGIFGGISADDNSLVDAEFDYKKHSVKDFASQQQVYVKKEVSAEDVEASRQAYELKKKQQAEQKATTVKNSSSSASTCSSQQSTVTMREKKTTEETQSAMSDKRRSSISSALLMDPAQAHAQAGIIDPS